MPRDPNSASKIAPDEAITSALSSIAKQCHIDDGAYMLASLALIVETLGPAPAMDFFRALNAGLLGGNQSAGVGKFSNRDKHIIVFASPGFDSVDDLKAKLDAIVAANEADGKPIKAKSYVDPDTN